IFEAPVLQHLGMQEVLVDRGELVVERLVEVFDDLGIALHGLAPAWVDAGDSSAIGAPMAERESWSSPSATRRRDHAPARAPGQAARASGSSSSTLRDVVSVSSSSAAVPTQEPHEAPQPVRMVSSAMLPQ